MAFVLALCVGLASAGSAHAMKSTAPPTEASAQLAEDREGLFLDQWQPPAVESDTKVKSLLPAVAAYGAWLIARFGVQWVIKNAPYWADRIVYSYFGRKATCHELRKMGSWWGWSWFCAGY